MDVMGREPHTPAGQHFRNNVWWWRFLWEYCCLVAPELTASVSGQTNDGDGLDSEGARLLADLLDEEIGSGRCQQHQDAFHTWRSELPLSSCTWCEGTGVRTDPVGVREGMPDKPLDDVQQILLGRDRGWCNGCNGEGQRQHQMAAYQFSVENVREFAEFLRNSGGFSIW